MNDVVVDIVIDNPKMISVNDQYIHPVRKTKSGRYMSYFVKSPYLKEVQKFYEEKLSELISEEEVGQLISRVSKSDGIGLNLSIVIGMPLKDIYESDTSNYIKSIEDCVSSRIRIDDSMNIKVSSSKSIYENNSKWILRITLSLCSLENFEC